MSKRSIRKTRHVVVDGTVCDWKPHRRYYVGQHVRVRWPDGGPRPITPEEWSEFFDERRLTKEGARVVSNMIGQIVDRRAK